MSKEEDEGKNKPKQDMGESLEREMLRSMRGETDGQDDENGEGKKQDVARNINYNYNSVRITDTVGVIVLGILSTILLLALLCAHRRERNR